MMNGVDTQALAQAMSTIRENPPAGLAHYGVALAWAGGTKCNATALDMSIGSERIERCYTWTIDEPPQLLGTGGGPTPQELLMSGVGACIMVGFVVAAATQGIELRSLGIKMTGSLDLAGFLNLREDVTIAMRGITYEIVVDTDASDYQIEDLERIAVAFSPNAMTVKNGVPLRGTVRKPSSESNACLRA